MTNHASSIVKTLTKNNSENQNNINYFPSESTGIKGSFHDDDVHVA
jgi:hypothetical protein